MPKLPKGLTLAEQQEISQEALDLAVRHAVFLQRFTGRERARMLRLLNADVFPKLLGRIRTQLERIKSRGYAGGPWKTKAYRELLRLIRTEVAEGLGMASAALMDDIKGLGVAEAKATVAQISRATGVVGASLSTPTGMSVATLMRRPVAGQPLAKWWAKQKLATRAAIEAQLNAGLAAGEGVPQLIRRLRGTRAGGFRDGVLQTTRNGAEAIVRSAVNSVSSQTREATYEANQDILAGVIYVATLDGRTTLTCIDASSRDVGLGPGIYPIGEGPRPPLHPGCRSTTAPHVDLPGAPPLPERSYGAWLRRQSLERQNEALGVRRATAWRAGKIEVGAFTDDDFQTITLQQLLDSDVLDPLDLVPS